MKRVHRLGVIAVLAVGTAFAPAFAGNVTVGRFYTEFARTKNLVPVDAASAEAKLRDAGFNLPELSLEKTLTEGDMASISNALGVPVTTHRPSQPISELQVTTFMSVFGRQLGAHGGDVGNPISVNSGWSDWWEWFLWWLQHHRDHDHDHSRHDP